MANTAVLGSLGMAALQAKSGTFIDASPQTLSTGDALPILREEVTRKARKFEDGQMVGQVHKRRPITDGWEDTGPIAFVGDYNYIARPLALAMGTAGAPTGTGPYTHRFQLHDSLVGIYASLGIKRGIDDTGTSDGTKAAFLYAAAKANGFTFSCRQGDVASLDVPWLARDLNDAASPAAWTYPFNVNTGMKYILLSHATVRINAQSGGALSSSDDVLLPTRIEVRYAPNLVGHIAAGGQIGEPVMQSPPVSRLVLEFPRITQALRTLLWDAFKNGTALKATVAFASSTYSLTFSFPFLAVDNDPDWALRSTDLVPFTVELHAQEATAAPTGMTGITKPIDVSLVNDLSTDALTTV